MNLPSVQRPARRKSASVIASRFTSRKRWSFAAASLLVLFLPSLSELHAQDPPRALMIWDFNRSLVNPLGGEYSVFGSRPSWARTYLDPSARLGNSGHSLRITAHRESRGFCGVWFDFHPQNRISQSFLDASGYRYLRFWIRGEKGGEDFDITLKDDTWRKHEDTNPTRPLHAYLARGATTDWQEVLVPLSDFKGLDSHKLVNLVFLFAKPGDYRLEVDDIALANGQSEHPDAAGAATLPALKDGRGLWVWNTANLLGPAHHVELERFLRFCSAQGVREVFLSLEIHEQERNGAPHFDMKDPEGYRAFLERAHQAGLSVEALAGTPEWAAEAYHAQALAAIDAVIEFNRSSPAPARFDGVHFDVEPYSLVGYADPAFRPQLLKQFLEMVAKCAERVHSVPGLRFGCDVPSWFYPNDVLTRQDLTVSFMDYRNEADGAGGIILAGQPALEYAAAHGKKIQVGLETSMEASRTIYFICGLPLDEFQQRLAKSDLRDELYFGDYRLATFSDDINVHVGLAAPEKLDGDARTDFEKALAKLALEVGACSDPERFPPDDILEEARGAIERDPELSGFEVFRFADPATRRRIVGFKAVRHMSPKITFYGLGDQVLGEESRSVLEWLSPYASFDGLAIHDYESYQELVEGP
jgi:hypothetical protein